MCASSLVVTFRLRSHTVLPERPIHLDGVIAYAMVTAAARAGHPNPLETQSELPLEKAVADNGEWVWKASVVHLIQQGGIQWHHHVRSFEPHVWAADRERCRWQGKTTRANDATGHQKAYVFNTPLVFAPMAKAWCVGDRDGIQSLLTSEVHHLGRNGRVGCGWIDSIEVEEATSDEAEHWRRRCLSESLGAHKLPEHCRGHATMHPPYWDRSARVPCLEFVSTAARIVAPREEHSAVPAAS